jgi:SNF2 family DNA or RNA helicase
VERLREIRREDPEAKALVFVQWSDLEAKVCRALKDHGVPFSALSEQGRRSSSTTKRQGQKDGAVLQGFQEQGSDDPDTPFVLVLSLQRAAAGTNLTAASHILFVHPMNAKEMSTAAAYERQALARVQRIGQRRKEVHVWRFVIKQTLEEHISVLHRDAPVEEVPLMPIEANANNE